VSAKKCIAVALLTATAAIPAAAQAANDPFGTRPRVKPARVVDPFGTRPRLDPKLHRVAPRICPFGTRKHR